MLRGFGLTENEALVYTYLLERGMEVGGSKIAVGTGIHRQYVYISMTKLIELGLVEAIAHGKHKKYKAIAPSQIEKIARRRALESGDIVRELNTFSTIGHEQDFEIYVGDRQVKEYEANLIAELKEGEIQYVISGASRNFLAYFGDDYEYLSTQAKQKKLTTYYVGGPHEKEPLATAQKINPYFNYRFLEGMPDGVTSTVVRQNGVVLYSLAKPVFVYVIHSKVVHDEYKKYFDMLWEMAK